MIKVETFQKDTLIFKKGDAADCMYRVDSGEVRIVDGYGTDNEQEIAILKEGSFFGEMAIIDNENRSTDAVALEGAVLSSIGFSDFEGFVRDDADSAIFLMQTLSERLRETDGKFINAVQLLLTYYDKGELEDSELKLEFKKIKARYGDSLIARGLRSRVEKVEMPMNEAEKGAIIFNEGDNGTIMYLVEDGEVDFFIGYSGKNKVKTGTAAKGEIFGEMAVLDSERRSATAVAATDVSLKAVGKDGLKGFIMNEPRYAMTILHNLSGRIRSITDEYLNILKMISEFVNENEERSSFTKDASWNEMVALASYYNQAQIQPFMMH